MITSDKIKFLATIVSVSPGADLGRWDLIAKHMKSYLRARSPFEEYFFGGKDCLQYFEKLLKPLVTGHAETGDSDLGPFRLGRLGSLHLAAPSLGA